MNPDAGGIPERYHWRPFQMTKEGVFAKLEIFVHTAQFRDKDRIELPELQGEEVFFTIEKVQPSLKFKEAGEKLGKGEKVK